MSQFALQCWISIRKMTLLWSLLMLGASQLIRYDFHQDKGQFISDRASNIYHAVNGSTLDSESGDVICTERGAYFSVASSISLPTNQVIHSTFPLATSFSVLIWFNPTGSGTLFTIAESTSTTSVNLTLSYSGLKINTTLRTALATSTVTTTSLTNSLWNLVAFTANFDGSFTTIVVYCGSDIGVFTGLTTTVAGGIIDSVDKQSVIGKNPNTGHFKGYIWLFEIYSSALTTADFSSKCTTVACAGGCAICPVSGVCISTQGNATKSNNGTSCSCVGNSCTNAGTCIACPSCNYSSCDVASLCVYPSTNYCYLDCSSCSGPNSYECLGCLDSYAIVSGGTCSCSNGSYTSSSSPLTCTVCDASCATCNGVSCLTCPDANSEITAGICVCKAGFYESGSSPLTCSVCDASCATCNGGTSSDCLNSITPPGCSYGFFALSLMPLVCSMCPSTCITCSNFSTCLSCPSQNFVIFEGSCICKPGFWPVNKQECSPCDSSCTSCNGGGPSNCLTCAAENSSAISGKCECDAGFVASSSSVLYCIACPDGCQTCDSENRNCITCKDPYAKPESQLCTCLENTAEAGVSCGQCKDGFYLSSVPSCEICAPDCLKCSSASSCLICADQTKSLTSDGTCVKLCEDGSYLNGDECVKCSSLCSDCPCTSCIDGAELVTNDECACKTGYYESDKGCQITSNTEEVQDQTEHIEPVQGSKLSQQTGFVASMIVTGMVLSNPTAAWGLLNTMQILEFVPLMTVRYPSELHNFFLSLILTDNLPNIFNFLMNSEGALPYNAAQRAGVSSTMFLLNSGSTLFGLGLLFMLWGAVKALSYIPILSLKKFFATKLIYFKWNVFIRYWIETYLELSFNCVLQLVYLSFDSNVLAFNSVFALIYSNIFGFSFLIVACCIQLRQLASNELSANLSVLLKFDSLFNEFKRDQGKLSMYFYSIFFLRRQFYVCILIFLRNWPMLQASMNICHSLMILSLILYTKPFEKSRENYLNAVGESIVLMVFLLSLCFNYTEALDNVLSKTVITVVLGFSVVEICITLYDYYIFIKDWIKSRQLASEQITPAIMSNSFELSNENLEFILEPRTSPNMKRFKFTSEHVESAEIIFNFGNKINS